MLDLDSIHKELPPNAQFGSLQRISNRDHHSILPTGHWWCTLTSLNGEQPVFAQGHGPTPSIAFARAIKDFLTAQERLCQPRQTKVQRIIPDITLEDLDL